MPARELNARLATVLALLIAGAAILMQQAAAAAEQRDRVLLTLGGIAAVVGILGIVLEVAPIAVSAAGRVLRHQSRPLVGVRGAPPLPPRLVHRPEVEVALREAAISGAQRGRTRIAALVGMAGAGKSVIASTLVHDPRTSRAYPDGLYWLTCGQRPSLSDLRSRLGGLCGITLPADSSAAEGVLQAWLGERSCLLVLDDVWEAATLEAFLSVGEGCGVVFTTRDHEIARSHTPPRGAVEVSQLAPKQSLELLRRWSLPQGGGAAELPPEAASIADSVGHLALGVAIAGGMVAGRGGGARAWREIADLFEAGIAEVLVSAAPDGYRVPGVAVGRQEAILMRTIELSIAELELEEQRHYDQLAAFAGRGPMPLATLQSVWEAAPVKTARLVSKLVDRSLGQRAESGGLMLHDLQYDVVEARAVAREHGLEAAHLGVVRAYREQCGGRWAEGPDDGYFLANIAFHLVKAGLAEELRATLGDIGWMQRRLRSAPPEALIADYGHLRQLGDLEPVKAALELAAPVLAHDRAALLPQLVGRLQGLDDDLSRRIVNQAMEPRGEVWFRARTPALRRADGEAVTVAGQGNPALDIAYCRGGPLAISCHADGAVHAWGLPLEGGKTTRLDAGDGPGYQVVVASDDANVIAAAGPDHFEVWVRGLSAKPSWLSDRLRGARGLDITPSGRWLAVAGTGDYVHVLEVMPGSQQDPASWRSSLRVKVDGHLPTRVALTADGLVLVAGFEDGFIRVWEVRTSKLLRTVRPSSEGDSVTALALTSDERGILGGHRSGILRVLDLASGAEEAVGRAHSSEITDISVFNDWGQYVTAGADGALRLWNLRGGEVAGWYAEAEAPILACAGVDHDAQVLYGSAGGGLHSVELVGDERRARATEAAVLEPPFWLGWRRPGFAESGSPVQQDREPT